MKSNIWKKINYKESLYKKSHHNSKKWLISLKRKIIENFKISKYKTINSKYFIASSPLPIFLLNLKKKRIDILDFGSGDHEIFFQLKNTVKKDKKVNIYTKEVKEVEKLYIDIKNKYLKNSKNVQLFIGKDIKKYDIIHLSDCLQYIQNWKKFLTEIVNKKPNYIFLNNLTAGSNNEYLTLQEYYGIKTPYRFFNLKKIISFFKDYEVIFKSHYLNSILNIYGEYPQKNFKKKDRLIYPSTIILKKKKND
jgi:putative methyltransferase (TIGR04325 family)